MNEAIFHQNSKDAMVVESISFQQVTSSRAAISVSLRNSTEAGTSDGRNTSFDHKSRMDEQSESMLSNTANPNIFAGGVQDDPLNMFREQSSDVLGKEFDNVEEAEEYYHKVRDAKGQTRESCRAAMRVNYE
ncbi:hypothetical protein JRO89_XS06G0124600 [Xanthoceras sorbifolium]|uniref:Uncharacterized protein n=1 Tax=Xanthoceras sorbifolium TaxID=99658 RepID=A0ABQ8HXX2_9ROSI|nr:hypothetical protein JRO89_XS06G0124600 [Xanthoceras sorbifolium]